MEDLCSAALLAAAPIAEEAGVPMIGYGTSSPAITDAGDYIFRVYPSDSFIATFLAGHLAEQGYTKAGVIVCLDDYCQGIADAFEPAFAAVGGVVTQRSDIEKTATDVRSELLKIKESEPEFLLAVLWPTSAIALVEQSAEMGWEIPVFGADSMSDPAIARALGDGGQNIQLALIDIGSMTTPKLEAHLESEGVDMIIGTPHAYDAVHLVAELMNAGATSGDELRDALYSLDVYEGVSGAISFDQKRRS